MKIHFLILFLAMEQIRTKEKYQVRQIRESREHLSTDGGSSYHGGSLDMFGENRLSSIKDVLQVNSKDILQIINNINSAKRDLGI